MSTIRQTAVVLFLSCELFLFPSRSVGQVCIPASDGSLCTPPACSAIPEEQCIATVIHLDIATGALTALACECLDFNLCHVEFGDASPFAVGVCPYGGTCEVMASDTDGDGFDDTFTAECTGVGACCVDIDDGPVPYDTCLVTDVEVCTANGGVYHSVNTACDDVQACCLGFAGETFCAQLPSVCCLDSGGVPLGPGSSCAGVDCNDIYGGPSPVPALSDWGVVVLLLLLLAIGTLVLRTQHRPRDPH